MTIGLGDEIAWICPTIQNNVNDIANSNNGTLFNGASIVDETGEGGSKAILFDATNEYLQVDGSVFGPTVIVDSLFPISSTFWIKVNDWNFEFKAVYGQRAGGSSKKAYIIYIYGDLYSDIDRRRKIAWDMTQYIPTNQSATALIDVSLTSNWHHIAWTKQQGVRPNTDGSVNFYVDGQLKSYSSIRNGYTTNASYATYDFITFNRVAAGTAANQYIFAYFDDYRFFHRELEQEEVSHLASARGVLGEPGAGGGHINRTLLGAG